MPGAWGSDSTTSSPSAPSGRRQQWSPGGRKTSDDDDNDDDDDSDDEDDEEARAARRAQRWTRRAFEAAQRGQMEQAAAAFEKAVLSTPEDAPYRSALLINAGSFLAFSGRAREALGPLREALSLAPEDPRALHALGNALHQCDAAAEALEVYARALEASPSADFPPNAPLLNNVATILLSQGNVALAARTLERSLDIEPNAPGTLFNLAMAAYSAAAEAAQVARRGAKVQTGTGVELWLETRLVASSRDAMRRNAGDVMRRVATLLDRAEPHAPQGSTLRERILALRGIANARIPGNEADARRDLEDVLARGAEHARDAKKRADALLELAQVSHPKDRLDILREAVAVLRDDEAKPERNRAKPIFFFGNNGEDAITQKKQTPRKKEAKKHQSKLLAIGQPADPALTLRARAQAELANALLDAENNCDAAFACYFAAADDGLGASRALVDSPHAAKLRDFDPRRFDDLLNLVTRNDAFAAIQALTTAIANDNNPNNHHSSSSAL